LVRRDLLRGYFNFITNFATAQLRTRMAVEIFPFHSKRNLPAKVVEVRALFSRTFAFFGLYEVGSYALRTVRPQQAGGVCY
jgi:hypothetical protein